MCIRDRCCPDRVLTTAAMCTMITARGCAEVSVLLGRGSPGWHKRVHKASASLHSEHRSDQGAGTGDGCCVHASCSNHPLCSGGPGRLRQVRVPLLLPSERNCMLGAFASRDSSQCNITGLLSLSLFCRSCCTTPQGGSTECTLELTGNALYALEVRVRYVFGSHKRVLILSLIHI